ncbi:MAG: Mu transposase C-terminal domain-containing protein [Pseudomonadota bacterium]|nr:Mu transposase C-terminal domain-containing protein [Pseudomonadota bacterium]
MHPAVIKYQNLPALACTTGWQSASAKARTKAQYKSVIVKHLLVAGSTIEKAFNSLKQDLTNDLAPNAVTKAVTELGNLPSRASVHNWCNAYKEQGIEGLLPNHRGRIAAQKKWANRSLELYHAPNSPSFAQVADELNKEGYDVKEHHVRRFINNLPHELGPHSPYRMGAKLYREKHKDFIVRSTENIPPGFIYNGDGHTLDVYLAHPVTGKAIRAELTCFQDVASRCIVGWELGYSENAIATLTALSRSMREHQHIPAMLYVDNGSGYKNKMINDSSTGFLAQFEIETIFAIPGNARAKWIERFFLHMEDRVGRRFETYCGRSHDDRFKRQMLLEVKQGKRTLPSFQDWITEFKAFLVDYHNSEHPERKGKTRVDVWNEIEKVAPLEGDHLVLPREKVNIRRGQFVLHKRTYSCDYLHQFNGQEMVAAYDLHDDSTVKIYKLDGQFVAICSLKTKRHALSNSRIVERDQIRNANAKKRLERKVAEIDARDAINRTIDVESVEHLAAAPSAIETKEPEAIDLDISQFSVSDNHEPAFELDDLL